MNAMSATEARRTLEAVGIGAGLRPCRLEVESRRGVAASELPELLRGGVGLLVYTDEVTELGDGVLSRGDRLLSAEVSFPQEARSVHVRWDGGAYRVTSYREGPGEAHLRYDARHLSVSSGKVVRYAVYVAPRPEGGDARAEIPEVGVWRPFAARFVGHDAQEQ